MIIRVVLGVTFGIYLTLSAIRPMISLYASSLGASTLDVGLLAAVYALLPLLLAMHVGRLSDAIGDRLPVVMGSAGMAAGLALPFAVQSLWALYLTQVIVGVSQLLCMVSVQNLIGKISTVENRDHQFATFTLSASVGNLIGPVCGGYLADHYSYAVAFLVAGAAGLIPVLLGFLLPSIKGGARSLVKQSSVLHFLKDPAIRRAMATSALVLYSRDIFIVYFPLFASEAGLSGTTIGWIISIQALAQIVVRVLLARLCELFGRNSVLVVSILMAGGAFLLMPMTTEVWILGLLSGLMGFGLGCGQPLSISTTYSASPKDRTGEVLGLRLAVNRLSQLVAPIFFGALGAFGGLGLVFYVSGAFLMGGAWLSREHRLSEKSED
jgi:MFS family permease